MINNNQIEILLVEDNPDDAELVKHELEKAGIVFSSRRVDTKEAFIKEIRDFAPDIILSDYSLPQFDGMSVIKLTKEIAPSIPVIMVTGPTNEEIAVECIKEGAEDYILKDRLARLGSAVVGILKKKELEKEKIQAEVSLMQSFKRLQETIESIIVLIGKISEMRDPYTAGHQQRVAQLSYAIAQEMGLSEEQKKGIYMAAMVHDIGKIRVPLEILVNPNGLTEYEFNIIKSHPKNGYEILQPIKFPYPIAQIIFQHHERMDGSGYPQGLSGKSILLESRILGVADTVEAMSIHRPYRPALGIEKAIEEISNKNGILYDPDVVTACLKVLKKGFHFSEKNNT